MAEEHDRTHRLLFSFPRLIEDLIRQCLGGKWVERLDFSTLEKVPERLVSPELVRREQDVLWRLLYRPPESDEPDWFYVYLHLEHLSSQPPLTALDMVVYDMVAYQDLVRRGGLTRDGKLPPILSVVFYNGDRAWTAPTSLPELVKTIPDAPPGVGPLSFVVVDAQHQSLVGLEGPLRGLFRLEQLGRVEDLVETARELAADLGPEDAALAGAFVELINHVILPKLTREDAERLRITELEELPSMLTQRIERITHGWEMRGWERGRQEGQVEGQEKGRQEGWREGRQEGQREGRQEGQREGRQEGQREGRQEGRREGRQEGRREGRQELFLKLFAAKHGEVPRAVRERIATADGDRLEIWAERLLRTERPEDVFKD